MDLLQVAPELAARLANYTLDDRARIVLRDIAPLVDAQLDAALDQVIAGAANLPEGRGCLCQAFRPTSSASR